MKEQKKKSKVEKGKVEKGISAGYVSTEDVEQDEPVSTKMEEKIEEKEKEERPKEETKPDESESNDTSRRTPEEKQQQYEEAYGMSAKKQAEAELQRKAPLVIRESLVNFVIEQEMLLRNHDSLKGMDGWLDTHPLLLLAKLMEEVGKLGESLSNSKSSTTIRRKAADVGNISMMIAHKSGKL